MAWTDELLGKHSKGNSLRRVLQQVPDKKHLPQQQRHGGVTAAGGS
jgi:hypothetical protein